MTATDTRVWTLQLPYTAPPLMDNSRLHWAKKARIVRSLRSCGFALAKSAKIPHLERAEIILHWQPATRRRRDIFGPSPTLKPLVDGITDAGVLTDDDIAHCGLGINIDPDPCKPGRLWLTIRELEGDTQ